MAPILYLWKYGKVRENMDIFVKSMDIFTELNALFLILNIAIFVTGKVNKTECSFFAALWSFIVTLFTVAFKFILTNGNVTTSGGLGAEIIIFSFFLIFTLASYALLFNSLDVVIVKIMDNEILYRNVCALSNIILAVMLIFTGVKIYNLNGVYNGVDGHIVKDQKTPMTFIAFIIIATGICIILYVFKDRFFKFNIDESERMIAKGYMTEDEWCDGNKFPICDKVVKDSLVTVFFSAVIMLLIVGTIVATVLYASYKEGNIFMGLPFLIVGTLIFGFVIYENYNNSKTIRKREFKWKYLTINKKEIKLEKTVVKYSGGVNVTETSKYYVYMSDGCKYEVDPSSYKKVDENSEVFIVCKNEDFYNKNQFETMEDPDVFQGKCQLYG
ncbi:hypothetical protein SAMN02910289_00153 [Lachnospiraceae bacterium RM5]|nr:hypothetical protein SAMN02910289_00153 [Lachnospiraceae bacterium RM5]